MDGGPVHDVARDLGMSDRQLRRRFHAAAGYGPKTLARILRFRRFVAAVDAGRSDLAGLAFDAGYADQPHLTRETRRLAALSPRELVAQRRPGA
jgi:transcriptional regulator GlxA family with amidase domain